jgi:hypothetical protein
LQWEHNIFLGGFFIVSFRPLDFSDFILFSSLAFSSPYISSYDFPLEKEPPLPFKEIDNLPLSSLAFSSPYISYND